MNEIMRKRILMVILIILLMTISFGIGYVKGSTDAISKMIEIGSGILDIKLTPRAQQVLINNPYIMQFAVENQKVYDNETNPFSGHPQAQVHWEYCMMLLGDNGTCYKSMISKYGKI